MLKLRKATDKDLEAIAAVEAVCFPQAGSGFSGEPGKQAGGLSRSFLAAGRGWTAGKFCQWDGHQPARSDR